MATTNRTWNKTQRNTGPHTNYTTLRNYWQQKIDSYRTLYTQTQGTPGAGRPSPATLKTFGHWIDKGAVIHKVSGAQINRWSPTNRKCTTITAAKNVLWHKFGKTPIKAICKSKSGSYLVATTPMYKGRYFKFPR